MPLKKAIKKNIQLVPPKLSVNKTKGHFEAHDGFYRSVVENLEDYAIFTTNKNGAVTSWNTGAEKLLGYKPYEILATNISRIFSSEDRKTRILTKDLAQVSKNGRTTSGGYHYRKDGSTFWASCLIFPVEEARKLEGGYTFVLRDLTSQKQIEQKKDDFINIASHELKTPMTSMKIFAEIIERQAKKWAIMY